MYVRFFLTHTESAVKIAKLVREGETIRVLTLDSDLDYYPSHVMQVIDKFLIEEISRGRDVLVIALGYIESIIQNLYMILKSDFENFDFKWLTSFTTKAFAYILEPSIYPNLVTLDEIDELSDITILDVDIDAVDELVDYSNKPVIDELKKYEDFQKLIISKLYELPMDKIDLQQMCEFIESVRSMERIPLDGLMLIIKKLKPQYIHFSNIKPNMFNEVMDIVQKTFRKHGIKAKVLEVSKGGYTLSTLIIIERTLKELVKEESMYI